MFCYLHMKIVRTLHVALNIKALWELNTTLTLPYIMNAHFEK